MPEGLHSLRGNRIAVLLLLVVISSLYGFSPAQAQTPAAEKPKPLTVTVRTFEQLAFHPLKKAPAYVVILKDSLLSSQLNASVRNIHVEVGDQVKPGQLLLDLDCDDYLWQEQELEADKDALKAGYDFTQYQFERSKKLLKTKSVSEESHRNKAADLKNLNAKITALDIKIKKARKNIRRCEIHAPFGGVISERSINQGEYVVPGSPLLRLININDLEVEVQVPITVVNEFDYKSLDFVYREEQFPVTLRAIIPGIETRARHQLVRLEFTGKKAPPNAFGMVHVELKTLQLPANVLVQRGGKTGIFILEKDPHQMAAELQVQTPLQASEQQSVPLQTATAVFYPLEQALIGRPASAELAPDTLIVLQGRQALEHGKRVIIKNVAPGQEKN